MSKLDLSSAICRFLIEEWAEVGQRVYQKRLPQSDGHISSRFPAIVVRSIGDRLASRSKNRFKVRVQIDVIDHKDSDKLEELKESLFNVLHDFNGWLYGHLIVTIQYLNGRDADLIDVGLDRKIIDYKVIHY